MYNPNVPCPIYCVPILLESEAAELDAKNVMIEIQYNQYPEDFLPCLINHLHYCAGKYYIQSMLSE